MARLLAASAVALAAAASPVLTPFGANSFRVQWAPPGLPLVNSTYSPFLSTPLSSSAHRVLPVGGAGESALRAEHGNLRIDVAAGSGLLMATRISDGAVLLVQTNLSWGPALARGRFPSAQLAFAGAAAGETLVGMGEQGLTGTVALARPFQRVYTDAEYYPENEGRQALMPMYLSSRGYGLVVAQQGYGFLRVDDAPADSVFNASSTATLDIWITTTPGDAIYDDTHPHPFLPLLTQYADAVGHAPLMPAFATGFIASKDRCVHMAPQSRG